MQATSEPEGGGGPENDPGAGYNEVAEPPHEGQPAPRPPEPQGRGRREWQKERFHPFDPRRKSPGLASFLSIAPGLGQVYVGYYRRGFFHILVVASIITTLADQTIPEFNPLFGIFLAFFWLYNIVDAGRRAALFNQALEGGRPGQLPDDLPAPGGGSMGAGVLLVIVGFVFLLNTIWDVPADWIADYWPMAPILFGAYLIVRSIQERQTKP